DDAARLLAGLRELLSVLGELTFGLRAGLFGTLEVALDLGAPLLEQGAHASAPTSSSSQCGDRSLTSLAGSGSAWARDQKIVASTSAPSLDDERERDAEQRQGLDQPDADEHRRSNLAGVLRLARHGLHGMPDQHPEPDPGPDRREPDDETAADGLKARADVPRRLSEQSQHAPSLSSAPRPAPRR